MKKCSIFVFCLLYLPFLPLQATTYHVATLAACADDTNNGQSITCSGADGPFKTLDQAIKSIQMGDTILIGKGIYFEQLDFKNKKDIVVMPYGNGRVTLSGAMEEYTYPQNGLWTYEGTRFSTYHNQYFKVYYSDYAGGTYTPNPTQSDLTLAQNIIVDDQGRKLWSYADSALFTQHPVKVAFGEGCYFDWDKVYIAFEDQQKNPNDVPLFLSKSGTCITVRAGSRITFDGGPNHLLTLNHTGRTGLSASDSAALIVRRMKFKNGHRLLYIQPTAGAATIENCEFEGNFDSLWTWGNVKSCYGNPSGNPDFSGCIRLRDLTGNPDSVGGVRTNETTAICINSDQMCIVRNNKISGTFNGILATGPNALIEKNRIWNIFDDAIETEGSIYNIIIRHNWVWDAYRCHAGVTIHPGPVYVYENIFCGTKNSIEWWDFVVDSAGMVELSRPLKYWGRNTSDSSLNTHYYYNTIYGVETPFLIGGSGCNTDSDVYASSTYNNIFVSESTISINSGKEANGVVNKSNIWWTTGTPTYRFTCWNDNNSHIYQPPMPISWTNNQVVDPQFQGGSLHMPWIYFGLQATSPAREANNFLLEPIPVGWPEAQRLNNQRTNAGAVEF